MRRENTPPPPIRNPLADAHAPPLEYPRQWVEVYRARHDRPKLLKALREVTRGFVGITDMPGVHFIEELCEIYPEARVVCVRRDPKRWLRSAQHMSDKMTAWYMPVLMWPMPAARWFSTWLELAVARTGEMGLLPFDEGERTVSLNFTDNPETTSFQRTPITWRRKQRHFSSMSKAES